jgi:hypothetical protein
MAGRMSIEVGAHTRSRGWRGLGLVVAITISATVTGALVGTAYRSVAGNRMAPWIVGRAAGVSAYLLLVALVLLGLLLSHPSRTRLRRPGPAARIRLHVALAVCTMALVALHVVVLATDRFAGVGWWGALVPMRASYRPVGVTLGLVGAWSGLLSGVTAACAGRLSARVWWPIHKIAAVALVFVWLHGVLAGGDSDALSWLYVLSGAAIVAVAVSRYAARTSADKIAELGG